MKRELTLAYIAFGIVCIVWGTTYLGIRIALETVPPLLLTGSRFTIAGLIMLAVARLRGEAIPRDWRTLGNIAFVGFLLVAVGNLAVVWAEQWVPSGLAALLVATAPFWMAIQETFRDGGERVNAKGVIGMIIGFAGVAMLVTPGGGAGATWSGAFLFGALLIQLGSIGWQLGSSHSKYKMKGVPLLSSAALQMLSGGVIVTLVGFAVGEGPRFAVNSRTLAAMVYLTLFGSVLAYSAYVYALAHLRTSLTSLYAYVNPVVAVFLGWLILDEPLSWMSLVAAAIILAGVALVQTSGRVKPVSVEPPATVKKAA